MAKAEGPEQDAEKSEGMAFSKEANLFRPLF